jgi:hypothetical protein
MCWSKRSSKHRRLKKPASSAPHGSPRIACSPRAPIRASAESVRAASVHPVSDPPAANWNVQAARAMATDPLTGTVLRAATVTVHSHRARIAQAGTAHRAAMVTGLTHRARIVQAGTVHRVAMGIGHSHRARIVQAGTARRVVMVTGLTHRVRIAQAGIAHRAARVTVHSHRVRIAQAGTARHVVTGIGHSHRVRIAQAGTVHSVVTGIGLRAVVVRPSNRVAASRLAADHPVVAVLRVARARLGVSLKQGSAACGLSPDGSKAVL